jgi:hypothetical protein
MDIRILSLVKGQVLMNLPGDVGSLPLSSLVISLYYHTPLGLRVAGRFSGSCWTSR